MATEIKREVKTFHVERLCETCKTGYMRRAPSMAASMELWKNEGYVGEPKILHICTELACKAEEQLLTSYPRIEHHFID